MINVSYEELGQIVTNKGYLFFEGEKNINIIGKRSGNVITNEFDDELFIAMQFGGGKQIISFEEFTTDPGFYYLKEKLLNPDGCAILKPGQYRGMWGFGDHKGKYPALVQVKPCTVYRDRTLDNIIDIGNEDHGLFGINMHHAFDAEDIDKYSAGCQVHMHDEQLQTILGLCKLSTVEYGASFTYTLLETTDF